VRTTHVAAMSVILVMGLGFPMREPRLSDASYPGQNDHKKRSRSHGGATKACVRDLRERRKRERDARRRSR
jgi:hypothetical protein